MKTQTSWKKGQSGNAKGAPKKELSLTSILKDKMSQIPDGETRTHNEIIADSLIHMSEDNKLSPKDRLYAIKEISNRTEGMPTQRLETEGEPYPVALVEFLN